MSKIKELEKLINNANNIVFFGGAGVSTESGIPDFRSAEGIYVQNKYLTPEQIISNKYFFEETKNFYQFYKQYMIHLSALPNGCHNGLARLEELGKLKSVITQNIDGLHQMAGSKNVIELHGTIHKNYCIKCNKFYGLEKILKEELPICECGGLVKPLVTLYGEALPQGVLEESVRQIENADLFIIGGTSLIVQPAASLIYYYAQNKPLVIINKSLTGRESLADLVIDEPIGEVFNKINYDVIK